MSLNVAALPRPVRCCNAMRALHPEVLGNRPQRFPRRIRIAHLRSAGTAVPRFALSWVGHGQACPAPGGMIMTVCPIALVASCKKCPAFGVCPLKGVLGDYKGPETPESSAPADKK